LHLKFFAACFRPRGKCLLKFVKLYPFFELGRVNCGFNKSAHVSARFCASARQNARCFGKIWIYEWGKFFYFSNKRGTDVTKIWLLLNLVLRKGTCGQGRSEGKLVRGRSPNSINLFSLPVQLFQGTFKLVVLRTVDLASFLPIIGLFP